MTTQNSDFAFPTICLYDQNVESSYDYSLSPSSISLTRSMRADVTYLRQCALERNFETTVDARLHTQCVVTLLYHILSVIKPDRRLVDEFLSEPFVCAYLTK